MKKFLAVVKHEYKKVVLKWSFLIGTFLLPLLAIVFTFVPALIFSMQSEPTRIAIIDPTGNIAPRLKQNLSPKVMAEKAKQAAEEALKDLSAEQQKQITASSQQLPQGFVFVDVEESVVSSPDVREELRRKIINEQIDAYLLIPAEPFLPDAVFEFRSRKGGDFVAGSQFQSALNAAVRSERLARENIDEKLVNAMAAPVKFDSKGMDERGEEKDTGGIMVASFVIGLMIYITLTIYGQTVMGAVVEEKETRIAEILFSSARPFELMMGKLVGVGLAGLTQLGIWVMTAAALIAFIALNTDLSALVSSVPAISPLMVIYFMIFFLLGFFIYASIFALIGSMVTSLQEGGQFAFLPVLILMIGLYLSFAVIRDPNSSLAFWSSVAPFFAPITMPVRILAEMPPFWHIGLSILFNLLTITGLVWLTSRVYRIGMLMYGKRATIPEVMKWITQK